MRFLDDFPEFDNPFSAIVLLLVFWLCQRKITHGRALFALLFCIIGNNISVSGVVCVKDVGEEVCMCPR